MRQNLRRKRKRDHDSVMKILHFDSLESTNKYCELLDPKSLEEFTVVCAHEQTAGKGQRGNTWFSEPYKNLTFSVILNPTFIAAADQYNLTMCLALAVAETIDLYCGKKRAQIKWPNDIYVDGKKICGILTSSSISNGYLSQSICGIGLNVNQTIFPDWIPNPTSIKLLTNKDTDTNKVLESFLSNLQRLYLVTKNDAEAIKKSYLGRLYRLDKTARYKYIGKEIEATIRGIDQFGHLRLEHNGKEIVCALKEVMFL